MGTIVERKRADGTKSFLARVRVMRQGKVHAEAQTFDRKPAANAWIKKREKELALPGELERAIKPTHTLGDAIDKYIEDSVKEVRRTKNQVLKAIKRHHIASMECGDIESRHLVEWLQELEMQPQTAGNYASHLSSIFAVARPMWGYALDQQAMKDAIIVARRMGIISRSKSRDRRPTLDELDKLLTYFDGRSRQAMPMGKVVAFAIFSTRRQEEIVTLRWDDLDREHSRILVRDMKHPGEKEGNDVWVDLPERAMAIIDSMLRKGERIFPYSTDAVSANFTRACKMLGIEDLHFHDLRHDGVSMLFELGWNIPQASAVSGHKSWTSLKRYTHIRQRGDKYAGWAWLERLCGQCR